jgi:Hemagglutinin repeat
MLAAGVDTSSSNSSHTERFSGLSVSFGPGGSNPLALAQKAASFVTAAGQTKNKQAQLLYGAAAAMQGVQGAQGLAAALASPDMIKTLTQVDAKVGYGEKTSKTEQWSSSQQASGGQALAGGQLSMTATNGDLVLTGATVKAAHVTLAATQDLILRSLALVDQSGSSSMAQSVFAGVDFKLSTSGATVGGYVDASGSKSSSATTTTTHRQTAIAGTDSVTLIAGNNATLAGAEVLGAVIDAQVAKNLTIVSDQDTSTQTASQSSWSAGGSMGFGAGASASAYGSYAQGKASGSYQSVTATSGLFAGAGGFNVTVGGTTSLTGAALASTADPSKNSLVTATLMTQDLHNASQWSAESKGVSFSASTSGVGGVSPNLGKKESGSSSGAASSSIATGTVTILDSTAQKALTGLSVADTLAALNRASTAQNQAADKLPSLSEKLADQTAVSAAFAAASSSTAKVVGDYAGAQQSDAQKAVDQLQDKEQDNGPLSPEDQQAMADAQAQVEAWKEGGSARMLLHGVTQGVLAGIGGGSVMSGLQGGAGAMAASALGPQLTDAAKQYLLDAGMTDEKTVKLLSNMIGELAVTGLGSAFGSAGAATAASVDMNNRQLHPDEAKLIRENAKKFAVELGLCADEASCSPGAVQQAEGRLTAQALFQVDSAFGDITNNPAAREFLASLGAGQPINGTSQTLFQATAQEFANHVQNIETLTQSKSLYALLGYGGAGSNYNASVRALVSAATDSANLAQATPEQSSAVLSGLAQAMSGIQAASQTVPTGVLAINGTEQTYVTMTQALTSALNTVAQSDPATMIAFVRANPELTQSLVNLQNLQGNAQKIIKIEYILAVAGPPAIALATEIATTCAIGAQICLGKLNMVLQDVVQSFPELGGTGMGLGGIASMDKAAAERVAVELEKSLVKVNSVLASGTSTFVAAEAPAFGTTVQLTKDVLLSNGQVIPAGSVVTWVENGYKVVAADGRSAAILTQGVAVDSLPLIDNSVAKIGWGQGNNPQGLPWEAVVNAKYNPGGFDLNTVKTNFAAFDTWVVDSGTAVSAKTMDTALAGYSSNPNSITSTLNVYVDKMVGFEKDGKGAFVLTAAEIKTMVLELAIPSSTSPAQWTAIQKSIDYANSKGVSMVVTRVK